MTMIVVMNELIFKKKGVKGGCMSKERIMHFRSWIAEQGIDAFIITQPQNRSYLSGWLNDDTESNSMLLVSLQQQLLLTNALYAEEAERSAVGWTVMQPEGRDYAATIAKQATEHRGEKVGFEADAMSYSLYDRIQSAGKNSYTLQAFERTALEAMRMVKDAEEIALLRKAIAITDETFAHVCEWIQPGMTEKEVQWEIARTMVALGADEPAFTTIVASGANGSMPHAQAGRRRIQRGELITIDMGARYRGYCADMTRTICLGEPAETRMREIYEAVLEAMKTCEAGLRAGISEKAADALARDVLAQKHLAEYYVHSTGHGVGLQIHEGPSLSPRASEDALLPAGCVVTVEPGVYIPGWSGLRIEDCVLVRENGAEVLTQSPTTLVIP
jgi:Xaa-Pro aminopeptidase